MTALNIAPLTARVLLLGGPGSGKGTQGAELTQRLGLRHIATGDLLRAEVRRGTALGRRAAAFLDRGALVPDELVVELITPEVTAADGYILDGFPRNVAQARIAGNAWEPLGLGVQAVVHLDVPAPELQRRLLARAAIEGRSDDTPEVIAHRLRLYEQATRPLVDFYAARGLLVSIAGAGEPAAVTAAILEAL
jgi:adenylate kinase